MQNDMTTDAEDILRERLRRIGDSSLKPHILFLKILGIIACSEFIVMVLIWYLDVELGLLSFLLDSIMLTFLSAPFLYLWVIKGVARRLKEEAVVVQTALERELTAKAHAEKAAIQEYSSKIIRGVPSGIIALSRDSKILSANPAAETLFSWTKESAVGGALDKTLPFNGLKEAVYDVLLNQRPLPNQIYSRSIDGADRHFQISIVNIDSGGAGAEAVLIVDDVTESLQQQKQIGYLASHDALTDLPNRRTFIDRIDQSIARMQRKNSRAAILFIDLDRFKFVNDTLGHNAGDDLLKIVADKLRGCVREYDTVARLGGDEFIILLAEIDSVEDATKISKRIFSSFDAPVTLFGHEIFITASMGISIFPDDGSDADTLIKNADVAMYKAKTEGRNNYQFYSEAMNAAGMEWLNLESKLRRALENREFVLHYQPQVDLPTGRVIGVEALVRWQEPESGLIPPGRFLPLAEETGLIVPLGAWLFKEACRQTKAWLDAGVGDIKVAINMSMRQFQEKDIVESVDRALRETGLEPSRVEIEVTESILMKDTEATIAKLLKLRNLGLTLAIDDFGTGYSSLAYLKLMPINRLKIAQSFIRDITIDPDDAAIAATILRIGHTLKLDVIAEGVETQEHLDALVKLGCSQIQGYLVSKALPPRELEAFLEHYSPARFKNPG